MPLTSTANRLFDAIPATDRFHLFYENDQPNAQRIVDSFFHFRKEEVSIATGVPVSSVRYDDRMPEPIRDRAIQWAVAINLVGEFFGDEGKTILWFQTPNPLLGSISPKEMIKRGRFRKLLSFIQSALDENKPPKK